jgi:hypothetical protein
MNEDNKVEVRDLDPPGEIPAPDSDAVVGGTAGAPQDGPRAAAGHPAGSKIDDAGLRPKWDYLRKYYASLLGEDGA